MTKLKFTLIALGVLFIVACSKNDSSNPNSNAATNIQGTWGLTGQAQYYYNSSNQVVYSLHNIDGNVGFFQYIITKDYIYSYYRYNNSPNYTLDDSSNYILNTSVNPMTLTGNNLSGNDNQTTAAIAFTIPLLTASQMVFSIKQTPDSYQDSTTGQTVQVAYSILLDTLAKQ